MEKLNGARLGSLTNLSDLSVSLEHPPRSETQFKIQHINHEMNKSVIIHMILFKTARGYRLLNHLSESEK